MRWALPDAVDSKLACSLAADAAVPLWVAEVLFRRGFSDAEKMRAFLQPRLRTLSDPLLLPAMDAAVARILAAVEHREKIALFGDYDVDGVTSLALLTRVLRAFGAEVAAFLPHRVDEGYGLTQDGVNRCIAEHSPRLLIAVDCGTTAIAEIRSLAAAGVDVVVLDHHEPKAELPPAAAIVNPKLGGGFQYLCSAGIAFKTAHALLKRRPLPGFDLKDMLDLAAIGTVADIVPLVDENRIFVKAGLERLAETKWAGLRALAEVAGLQAPYRAADIGFGIGPRLNAAGRLASAEAALELLLTDEPGRAKLLARSLDQQNRERREVEDDVFAQAVAQVESHCSPAESAAIVVGATGWHPGVVGIVASRILRRYHRPTFVVGFDQTGLGKGSGRSIEGLSLVGALGKCAGLLDKFGGHEMAAGLTMRQEFFAEFRTTFTTAARAMVTDAQLVPKIALDGELSLSQIRYEFLTEHDCLQPFGTDNRQPVFFARRVTHVGEPRVMKEKHLGFTLRQGRHDIRAVWWNAAEFPLPPLPWDVAFTVARNEWNGSVSPQLELRDIRTSALA